MGQWTVQSATALAPWAKISARGPQSLEFLQGQLSQDLSAVKDDGMWTLLLEPDSAVISSALVRQIEDGFSLTLSQGLAEVSLRRLSRFLLRVKCVLEREDDTAGPVATVGELVTKGWPGENEFRANLVPQAFGNHFVESTVSFSKGCFTGQELVGRLDARGSSVPWRLVRVEGESPEEMDSLLRSKGPSGPQGLTSVIERESGFEALGIAHRSLLGLDGLAGSGATVVSAIT